MEPLARPDVEVKELGQGLKAKVTLASALLEVGDYLLRFLPDALVNALNSRKSLRFSLQVEEDFIRDAQAAE